MLVMLRKRLRKNKVEANEGKQSETGKRLSIISLLSSCIDRHVYSEPTTRKFSRGWTSNFTKTNSGEWMMRHGDAVDEDSKTFLDNVDEVGESSRAYLRNNDMSFIKDKNEEDNQGTVFATNLSDVDSETLFENSVELRQEINSVFTKQMSFENKKRTASGSYGENFNSDDLERNTSKPTSKVCFLNQEMSSEKERGGNTSQAPSSRLVDAHNSINGSENQYNFNTEFLLDKHGETWPAETRQRSSSTLSLPRRRVAICVEIEKDMHMKNGESLFNGHRKLIVGDYLKCLDYL